MAKPTKSTKPTTKTATAHPSARRLQPPRRRWWRRTPKKDRPRLQPLPSGWNILNQVRRILWQHKKLFAGIVLFYALFSLILVQGSNNVDVQSLKSSLANTFNGSGGQIASSVSIIGYLISSPAAGAYQLILLFIVSLACVWALRQVSAGRKIRIRDAYYRGMYPLIPLVMVVLIILVQLIPFALGSTLYNIVATYGVAASIVELLLWGVVALFLVGWSIYLILPSIIGLFVVTLPDMTPRRAVRSARQLVHFRRWNLIRKFLLLTVVLVILVGLVMVPAIIFAAPAASWIFFALSPFLIVTMVTYGYMLYLELLNHAPTA